MPSIDFLIPGDIETLTGGYAYDRRLAAGLRRAGWQVETRALEENLAAPDARARAAALFDAVPDGARVLIDGLALAELTELVAEHGRRLCMTAIVHHPAGMETGLSAASARQIARRETDALRYMRSIVCTSDWTARQLVDCGLEHARIHVVEPGVDIAGSPESPEPIRRDPRTAHIEGLRLLCVATLTPRKGHDVLIEALAALSDVAWQLECIGSRQRAPEHTAAIESLIEQHGLQRRVHLRGEVPQRDLAIAYARADLFVLASRLEGYGMVLAEARAAGLPIVATRGGAVTETLENNAAVVTVEPDSPRDLAAVLRNVIADQQTWLDLAARAARDAGSRRSWDDVALEFSAALESQARA